MMEIVVAVRMMMVIWRKKIYNDKVGVDYNDNEMEKENVANDNEDEDEIEEK